MTEFFLVQHGEKVAGLADPPLTTRGIAQAERTALFLRASGIERLVSSPARRARETGRPLAASLALPLAIDDRLRERMEWVNDDTPDSLAIFLREWAHATSERDYWPCYGDSSRAAGARLLAVLDDLSGVTPGARIALFTHGGATLDLLRTLFGERALAEASPGLLASGPSGGAVTRIRWQGNDHTLVALCSTAHLDGL